MSVGEMPLVWRVFAANAAVFVLAAAALALSPATVSFPLALAEATVLLAGLVAMLAVNLVLTRRLFSPLERLTALMRSIDPLEPGVRVESAAADPDVQALAAAFNDMLDRLEGERRDSGRRALAAQEFERVRVARELHDEVGQTLTGVMLGIERVGRGAPPDVRDALVELREAARGSLDDVRRIARELRPEALDDLGLASALNTLATRLARDAGVRVDRRLSSDTGLSPDAELVVYRVAQEALTNIARHADARRVELVLERRDRVTVLRVRDDGRGFDPRRGLSGDGIRGMRERAVLIGGRLVLHSAPGDGAEVRLEVPVV
jgi:two-component system sensor histidine kinase UhpB